MKKTHKQAATAPPADANYGAAEDADAVKKAAASR